MAQSNNPKLRILPGSFLFLVLSGEVSSWELEVLNRIPFSGLEIDKSNREWIWRSPENGVEQGGKIGEGLITPNLSLGFPNCLAVYYRGNKRHMEKLIRDAARTSVILEGKPMEEFQKKERDLQHLVSLVCDYSDELPTIQQFVEDAVKLTKNLRG